MHTVRFYIAYPTDQIPPEIFSRCKQEGIGILTLPILNEKDLDELRADDVFEALEPKEVKLDGMSHASQKLDGTFLDCINRINYLKQMFPSPEKLYNDFIGTEIKKKRNEDKQKKEFRLCSRLYKDRASREARNFLRERIESEFPELKMHVARSTSTISFAPSDGKPSDAVLSIEQTASYFYILLEGKRKYRVYSREKIIEYEDSGKDYEGNLKGLITSVIIPHVRTELLNRRGK